MNKLKHRYNIVSNLEQVRRGTALPKVYAIKELAQLINIDSSWFYRKIRKGLIRTNKNPTYSCYLFPRTQKCIDQLKLLKEGQLAHVTFPKVH